MSHGDKVLCPHCHQWVKTKEDGYFVLCLNCNFTLGKVEKS